MLDASGRRVGLTPDDVKRTVETDNVKRCVFDEGRHLKHGRDVRTWYHDTSCHGELDPREDKYRTFVWCRKNFYNGNFYE